MADKPDNPFAAALRIFGNHPTPYHQDNEGPGGASTVTKWNVLLAQELMKRRRGRPRKLPVAPKPRRSRGRPQKYTDDDLMAVADFVEGIKPKLSADRGGARVTDKDALKVLLLRLAKIWEKPNPERWARQQLKTYQNLLARGKKLSRKMPKK